MKISKAIETLKAIKAEFGDLEIIGGYMNDETPLREIAVVNKDGNEIWPERYSKNDKAAGVFLGS